MTELRGLDLSFSGITPPWATARFAEGYRVAFQCLWTGGLAGNPGIKAVAENNLRTFREAGFVTGGYVNATPPDWWPLAVQMQHIRENAGAEWSALQHVATDLEIPRLTFERAAELADAITAEGKRTEIAYSAAWFWNGLMGVATDPHWRQRFPKAWPADYDGDPNLATATLYGPWGPGDLVGKQFTGTTNLDGVQVDLNVFDGAYFAPGKEDDFMALSEAEQRELLSKTREIYDVLVGWKVGPLDAPDGRFVGSNIMGEILGRLRELGFKKFT